MRAGELGTRTEQDGKVCEVVTLTHRVSRVRQVRVQNTASVIPLVIQGVRASATMTQLHYCYAATISSSLQCNERALGMVCFYIQDFLVL